MKADEYSRIVVSVRQGTGSDTFPEVELEGNRNGLIWLAEQILRVAHADRESHTHLDMEANAPVYLSPDGWWLTISRTDRLR